MEHIYEVGGNAIALDDIKNIEEIKNEHNLNSRFIVKFKSSGSTYVNYKPELIEEVRNGLVKAWNSYINNTRHNTQAPEDSDKKSPIKSDTKHIIHFDGIAIALRDIDYVGVLDFASSDRPELVVRLKSSTEIKAKFTKGGGQKERTELIEAWENYIETITKVKSEAS